VASSVGRSRADAVFDPRSRSMGSSGF